MWFSYIHHFRKIRFPTNSCFATCRKINESPHPFFIKFHDISCVYVGFDFSIDFNGRWLPKMIPKSSFRRPGNSFLRVWEAFWDTCFLISFNGRRYAGKWNRNVENGCQEASIRRGSSQNPAPGERFAGKPGEDAVQIY